jgi:hypothetical protein
MKTLIISIVAILLTSFVNAQNMKFGVKGGLNLASISDAEGSSMRIGAHAGGYLEFKLTEKFAIQPEFLYSMQGVNEEYDFGVTKLEAETQIDYLTIPVMLKLYPTKMFNIQVGPQIGLLVNDKVKLSSGGNSQSFTKTEFNKTDLGLNFGIGVDLPTGLNFYGRYSLGLSKLVDEDDSFKNRVIQIGLGYTFQ